MPKLKISEYEQKKILARAVLKKRMEIKQITVKNISKKLRKPESTLYDRFANTNMLRLEDLWGLVSYLGLTDQEILQIVRGREGV
jgi:hypothetical protein